MLYALFPINRVHLLEPPPSSLIGWSNPKGLANLAHGPFICRGEALRFGFMVDKNKENWREALKERFYPGSPAYVACGDGWKELIVKLVEELDRVEVPFKILQIKEKFGGLRFYVEIELEPKDSDDEARVERFRKLISEAEDKSFEICEECGAPGFRASPFGWIFSLCNRCWYGYRMGKRADKLQSALKELAQKALHGFDCCEEECLCGMKRAEEVLSELKEEERVWKEQHPASQDQR
jgi:hypothetical protein